MRTGLKTALILAAGGASRRFGGNKLFAPLQGEPLFLCALRRLLPCVDFCVIAVADAAPFQEAVDLAGIPEAEKVHFAPGGATRQESVENALQAVPADVGIVAVQDAARPLVTASLLEACVAMAEKYGSGVAAHRVVDTIKIAEDSEKGGMVQETPPREKLWAAETPQVFRRQWLEGGYRYCREAGIAVTDDADAVHRAGYPVRLVENPRLNLKVTGPQDLVLVQSLLAFQENNLQEK